MCLLHIIIGQRWLALLQLVRRGAERLLLRSSDVNVRKHLHIRRSSQSFICGWIAVEWLLGVGYKWHHRFEEKCLYKDYL